MGLSDRDRDYALSLLEMNVELERLLEKAVDLGDEFLIDGFRTMIAGNDKVIRLVGDRL